MRMALTAEEKRLRHNARRLAYYHANKEKCLELTRRWQQENPEHMRATRHARIERKRQANPRKMLLAQVKGGAGRRGLAFELTEENVLWPTHCPVFGVELVYICRGGRCDESASIDRFDNTIGYTPENVRVISWRANSLKADASAEEIEKLLAYMKG